MGNINLLEIFALILTISVSSAFNLRKIGNDTMEQQQKKGAEIYSRIYRGYPAEYGDFLYQVGLRTIYANEDHEICGGSLLTVNYVLTAAQCVKNGEHIMVHLGSNDLHLPEIMYNIGMHDVQIHHDYVRKKNQNNIAVIKIQTVALTHTIRTIRLPQNDGNFPSYAGAGTVLAGWGETYNTEQKHNMLRFVPLEVITLLECDRSHKRVDGTQLCAVGYGSSGCTGDYGSPLVLGTRSVPEYQIGIFTNAKCVSEKPNIFTRIDHYFRWLKDNTDLNI